MAKKKNKKENAAASRFLLKNAIMDPGLKFRVEEAYKSIRTNIMLSVMKKGARSLWSPPLWRMREKQQPPQTLPFPYLRQIKECC